MERDTATDPQKQTTPLSKDETQDTMVNPPEEISTRQLSDVPDIERIPRFGDSFTEDSKLVLWHEDAALPVEFKNDMVIGREHPKTGYMPDLDLIPYGGSLMGVSRRHARIMRKDDMLFVEDLGSTNGTWLNGIPLLGGQRVLRNGDLLLLGHFKISVEFRKKA